MCRRADIEQNATWHLSNGEGSTALDKNPGCLHDKHAKRSVKIINKCNVRVNIHDPHRRRSRVHRFSRQ